VKLGFYLYSQIIFMFGFIFELLVLRCVASFSLFLSVFFCCCINRESSFAQICVDE
jgi:hypothetical protein